MSKSGRSVSGLCVLREGTQDELDLLEVGIYMMTVAFLKGLCCNSPLCRQYLTHRLRI